MAAAHLPGLASVARAQQNDFNPRPGTWRTFEITTRVEVLQPAGVGRVWLPVPRSTRTTSSRSRTTGPAMPRSCASRPSPKYGAVMLYAEFAEGEAAPMVELTSRFKTQDRALDWSKKVAAGEDARTLESLTAPTDLMPTDGIVKEDRPRDHQGQARPTWRRRRRVYDWIVDNTHRDPKARGCGVGDIKAMLETGNLGGKCADLNALFVGLARSVGLPARDIYGIRVRRRPSATASARAPRMSPRRSIAAPRCS